MPVPAAVSPRAVHCEILHLRANKVGVAYTTVGITTADYDGTEYLQRPEGASE